MFRGVRAMFRGVRALFRGVRAGFKGFRAAFSEAPFRGVRALDISTRKLTSPLWTSSRLLPNGACQGITTAQASPWEKPVSKQARGVRVMFRGVRAAFRGVRAPFRGSAGSGSGTQRPHGAKTSP